MLEIKKVIALAAAATIASSLLIGTSANATGENQTTLAQTNLSKMVDAFNQQFPETKLGALDSKDLKDELVNPFIGNERFSAAVIAEAQADECFAGIGVDYPAFSEGVCRDGAIEKTNQSYVWGMTNTAKSVWFGTGANVLCLVEGAYFGARRPSQNDTHVCEFASSQVSRKTGVPATFGDVRKPHMYRYAKDTSVLTDLSSSLTGTDLARLDRTLGLRSAGAYANSIVYLAGPSIGLTAPYKGISIFAFNADSGSFLGSTSLEGYTNIRSWLNADKALYAGVSNRSGGGSVLRFEPTLENPFSYTVVASNIDGEAAELAVHKDRLYVSTWPNTSGTLNSASVWMSPKLSKTGLTGANATAWSKAWSVDQYEPDPVVAKTYGGGAMFSYKGDLYWGTMHVPLMAAAAKWRVYGGATNQEEALTDVLGTHRALSLFRVDDFSKSRPKVELLYGQPVMPVWEPGVSGPFGSWTLKAGGMGIPKYGLSGFGNPFNNYTWSMNAYREKLYIGTMDWSFMALASLLPSEIQSLPSTQVLSNSVGWGLPISLPNPSSLYGADLWSFSSSKSRAKPENITGVGNSMNYGIRTMTSDSNGLYLGTANPMNLSEFGGWEVLKVGRTRDRDRDED